MARTPPRAACTPGPRIHPLSGCSLRVLLGKGPSQQGQRSHACRWSPCPEEGERDGGWGWEFTISRRGSEQPALPSSSSSCTCSAAHTCSHLQPLLGSHHSPTLDQGQVAQRPQGSRTLQSPAVLTTLLPAGKLSFQSVNTLIFTSKLPRCGCRGTHRMLCTTFAISYVSKTTPKINIFFINITLHILPTKQCPCFV